MMKNTVTIGATISALVSTSTMAQKKCEVSDFKELIAPAIEFNEKNSKSLNKCRADLGDGDNAIEEAISLLDFSNGSIDVPDDLQAKLMSLVAEDSAAFCGSQNCQKSLTAFKSALKGLAIPDCTINGAINPSTVIPLIEKACEGIAPKVTAGPGPGHNLKGSKGKGNLKGSKGKGSGAAPTLEAPTGGSDSNEVTACGGGGGDNKSLGEEAASNPYGTEGKNSASCHAADFIDLLVPGEKFLKDNSALLDSCQADLGGDAADPIDAITKVKFVDGKIEFPKDIEAKLIGLVAENTEAFCASVSCQGALKALDTAVEGLEIPDCTINGLVNPSKIISQVQDACNIGGANPTPVPTKGGDNPTPVPTKGVQKAPTCQVADFIELVGPGEKFVKDNSALLDSCQADLGDIADPIDAISKVQLVDGEIKVPDEVEAKLVSFVAENTEAFCASVNCQGALKALDTAVKGLKIPDCTINGRVNPSTIISQVQDACNIGTNFNLGTSAFSAKSGATSVQKASFILSAVAVISFALMM